KSAKATAATAATPVTTAISRLPSPSQVSRSSSPMDGPSSNSSSSTVATSRDSSLFMQASVLAQRVDRGGSQAELVEDLAEVLQVANQRAAPGLEVELGRHDDGVTGLDF